MDHSNHFTSEALHQLKTSFSDCDEVISVLPNLVKCFESEEDAEVLPELISLLLGQAVHILPLQDVNHAVLEPFLPQVKQYLEKMLFAIHNVLESNISQDSLVIEITKHLEICIQVLTDIDNLLMYIISLSEVTASDVSSLPKNIADILHHVFIHCQKSKAEYKENFTAVRNELMALFQTCHKVQLSFFTLLNVKLVFNCTFEEELNLLVDVLDALSSMAEVVAELDTKSLVAHWKNFAQLTQSYASHLSSRWDVDRSIKYLAVNISHQLTNFDILVNSDKRAVLRSLKITSLEVKVLIKLCEQYKGYLGECHVELLKCLVSLTSHSSHYLSQRGVAADIAAQITTHILAGAGPLVTHLISDPQFVKEYLNYTDTFQSCSLTAQVGFCHLTNLILKKLIQRSSKNEEVEALWIKPSLPLLNTVFSLLRQCSASGGLLMGCEDDVYPTLLVHTTACLVVTCSQDMFPHLERLLLQHLLQPLLWPALFSSDVLCLIARCGSSELCHQLTSLLAELLSQWPVCDFSRPEYVYVSWTLSRLMQLLSSDHLKAFPSRLPSLPSLATDTAMILTAPFSDQTSQLFQSVMKRLALLGDLVSLLPAAHDSLAGTLCQLWQYVSVPPDAEATENMHWFLGFFSILAMATSNVTDLLNNCQIGHILDVLLRVSSLSTTLFHCTACNFLRSLASKTLINDQNQTLVCQRISSLFVQLLKDNNPVTKQISLETFSYFAYVTKYEQIVPDTVANDTALQAEITDYLECIPNANSETDIVIHLKNLKQNFVHKCKISGTNNTLSIINKPEFVESESNPCKRFKKSFDEESVSDALRRINTDINFLEEHTSNTALSQPHLSIVKNVLIRLNNILKTP